VRYYSEFGRWRQQLLLADPVTFKNVVQQRAGFDWPTVLENVAMAWIVGYSVWIAYRLGLHFGKLEAPWWHNLLGAITCLTILTLLVLSIGSDGELGSSETLTAILIAGIGPACLGVYHSRKEKAWLVRSASSGSGNFP
jgi:hypothetical protein